jgi:hypothetical protein
VALGLFQAFGDSHDLVELKERIAALEGRRNTGKSDEQKHPRPPRSPGEAHCDTLPPHFWESICGIVPLELLDPDTRRLVAPLFEDGCDAPDPIEETIHLLGTHLPDGAPPTASTGRGETNERMTRNA